MRSPATRLPGARCALFVVGAKGDNQLVNYRMRGNHYVVDRLFAAAELRLGTEPQQVVRITRTDGKPRRRPSLFARAGR
jgi:type IV secretory pathway VirB9-like protein